MGVCVWMGCVFEGYLGVYMCILVSEIMVGWVVG